LQLVVLSWEIGNPPQYVLLQMSISKAKHKRGKVVRLSLFQAAKTSSNQVRHLLEELKFGRPRSFAMIEWL